MNAFVQFYDESVPGSDAMVEILEGLKADNKYLSPKFFYDEKGSELFTAITRLPEYYLTRTEVALLKTHVSEISELVGDEVTLIEYGSGSSEKIRLLLEHLRPAVYAPLDISKEYLAQAVNELGREFPWLNVRATCVDFTGDFSLPFQASGRKVAFFPGSSIGNFERTEAAAFLGRIRNQVGDGGGLLLGVDLKKNEQILNAAYNDSAGVTAEFNLNALSHLNEQFDADFRPELFSHQAAYNEHEGCIQMFLESTADQTVTIAGEKILFSAGEVMHTENSHKYTVEEMVEMARAAGFSSHHCWQDQNSYFAVIYCSG